MNKIQQTKQQRENTLDARYVMWPGVPPKNVARRLEFFREDGEEHLPPHCGTIACFGGLCAWWPPYRAQGVYTEPVNGAPRLSGIGSAFDVANKLFGQSELFDAVGEHPADDKSLSAHENVTRRLNWLLENSEVIDG